jgi:hypothetical protein
MSLLHADTITLRSTSNNPFEAARCTLIKALARMPVPAAIGSFPAPNDFIAISDHLYGAAEIFDAWLRDVGHQVSDNASAAVDLTLFDDAFVGAVDGNATFACEQAADALRDQPRVA